MKIHPSTYVSRHDMLKANQELVRICRNNEGVIGKIAGLAKEIAALPWFRFAEARRLAGEIVKLAGG